LLPIIRECLAYSENFKSSFEKDRQRQGVYIIKQLKADGAEDGNALKVEIKVLLASNLESEEDDIIYCLDFQKKQGDLIMFGKLFKEIKNYLLEDHKNNLIVD
jgi:hypothetical protein